jgi:hypothetical protein
MKKYRVLVLLSCFALGVALNYKLHESALMSPVPLSPVAVSSVPTQPPGRCVVRPAGNVVEDLPDGGKRVIESWLDCEGEQPRVGVSTVYSKEEWNSLGQRRKAGEAQSRSKDN